ncbi:hypothetical protein N9M10_00430 [Hellea sp.]|nr:hypothetical protein [Hellea sp.]
MMRLVKSGLMFGNLVEIKSLALVERYNRALEHLIGRTTELTEFHVDISGYSPEIGHEFEDDLYLNPKGTNRMFILLSTDQKTAPLLNSQFSTSRSILRHYIEKNEDQLFALTAREAVAGELMNSVFSMETPQDLLHINQIDIEADTIQEHVAEANLLGGHIEQFMTQDDAWWDDVLISEMIELAKRTGDIQRNPVELKTQSYTQGNYYTSHFGGVYVFRDTQTPTIIAREMIEGLDSLSIENILTFEDRDEIAKFLRDEGLSELIVQRPNESSASIIKQKIDFITITTAAELGHDLKGVTRRNMRMLERRFANDMPPEFNGLMEVYRWASHGGGVPKIGPEHPAFFYALRSSQHEDRDLVNMLLSDLSRMDFRQLFICHKPLFYEAYRNWGEPKKDYVSKFLAAEYAMDKVGAREALFGAEPKMEEPESLYSAEDYSETKKKRDVKSPWGVPLIKDGKVQVKYRKKDDDDDDDDDDNRRHPRRKGRGLREELDWDKKKYRGKGKKGRKR